MFCALWGAVDIRLKLSQVVSVATLTLAAGCAVSRKTVVAPVTPEPALSATKAELIDRYNHEASAVESITAAVRMLPTAGSALSGVIEKYHQVNGYILAERPASIRVIGQAPVVAKDIFDMASDGETFHMFIPSKNEFIEGPADLRHAAKRPIENLRPQHLLEALIWPAIPSDAPVLLEEVDDLPARYYVITIAQNGAQGLELERKVWFDRTNLQISRLQIYDAEGAVVSDIQTKNWQPAGATDYARDILVDRPVDDYRLEIVITQLTLNQTITADRFHLAQPAGTQLVRLGEDARP
jgi:hypothetical protein